MIQVAEAFVKNEKNLPPQRQVFHRHAIDLFDEMHIRYLDQKQDKFPTIALFLDRKDSVS